MDDATRAQVVAARPDRSTWLSANAGSGKTRVLTDRVARLLLAGTEPERILCLTYTKAAAMEMQNRLFDRLGAWAMYSDEDLSETLSGMGVRAVDADVLAHARTLFARAIEAPGGLKIQTIHSFCSSVLRRFPLEAGVSPAFTEIDERVQRRLLEDVLSDMAGTAEGAQVLTDIVAHLSSDDGPLQLAERVLGDRDALARAWTWGEICAWLELPETVDEQSLINAVLDGSEASLVAQIAAHLDNSIATQATLAERLLALPFDQMTLDAIAELESVCLVGSGDKAGTPKAIANKAVRAAMGADLVAAYDAMADRVAAARPHRLAYLTARRTAALHQFAAHLLPAFQAAKDLRAYLDFDDLIVRTRGLLAEPGVAQWVLFRLDGGIDHILVDEAQDTSPAQWDIIRQLAEDFAAGAGAREEVERTIFVVGDKKQSIYSFQGADPAGFDRMRDHFADQLAESQTPLQTKDLIYSFRSAPLILDLVDAVAARAAAPGVGPDVTHRAFFDEKPGRVDLWPVIPDGGKTEKIPWDDPMDQVAQDHHSNRLARAVAANIDTMLKDGTPVRVDGKLRPVEAGDILILLRSRTRNRALFERIIREIKALDLPIAGADRTDMTTPLAVKDLVALLRFLSLPEDNLSLAEVLRSPLAGWDEDMLFRLAHGRKDTTYLWRALQDQAARYPETVKMLGDLRDAAEFQRPYDVLERALVRWDGRRRLLARLGPEAEDAIDALLDQALIYEAMEVPSLTGFIGWMESGDVIVKRDLAKPNGQIRVMTMHGAKGLEAPVVILPDCAKHSSGGGGIGGPRVVATPQGPMTWVVGRGADQTPQVQSALAEAARAEAEETDRLLYVGLTRAESWLIVAASGDVGKTPAASWYLTVKDAIEGFETTPLLVPGLDGPGLRLQSGDWAPVAADHAAGPEGAPLPAWIGVDAPPSQRATPMLTPSDLGGAKAIFEGSGTAEETADALRRGRLVHLFLEHLPRLSEDAWDNATPGIAALEASDVTEAEILPLLDEAKRVLRHPDLAHVFAPGSLAEVAVTGRSAILDADMMGVIDRLIVEPDRLRIVDFKTNRVVPAYPEAVPEGLLRQMGAYAELLQPLYPDHQIDLSILWSRTARLMDLPHDLVFAALQNARSA